MKHYINAPSCNNNNLIRCLNLLYQLYPKMEHCYNMKQKQIKRPTEPAKLLMVRHPPKCPSCNVSDDVILATLVQYNMLDITYSNGDYFFAESGS